MNYRFHPAALAEHLDQVAFYESQLRGLGADYLATFDRFIQQICSHPQAFPHIQKTALRRAVMKRYPFQLIYLVLENQVYILAIAHHKRRPSYWAIRQIE